MGRPARKYVKRVQTMLTKQQYELLREYAQEINQPLSVLVREAVEQSLIIDLEKRRKQKALEWMSAQELPVGRPCRTSPHSRWAKVSRPSPFLPRSGDLRRS